MGYLLTQKKPLTIIDEQTIPVPMSHVFASKADALKWGFARVLFGFPMRECEAIHTTYFTALGGSLP